MRSRRGFVCRQWGRCPSWSRPAHTPPKDMNKKKWYLNMKPVPPCKYNKTSIQELRRAFNNLRHLQFLYCHLLCFSEYNYWTFAPSCTKPEVKSRNLDNYLDLTRRFVDRTVCPRSSDPFNIVAYYINGGKNTIFEIGWKKRAHVRTIITLLDKTNVPV